jgi:hypothetical protein
VGRLSCYPPVFDPPWHDEEITRQRGAAAADIACGLNVQMDKRLDGAVRTAG